MHPYYCLPLALTSIPAFLLQALSKEKKQGADTCLCVCVCVVCMSAHCKDENFAAGLLHGQYWNKEIHKKEKECLWHRSQYGEGKVLF